MTESLPIRLSALPALNAPLGPGTFAGLTTRADGVHCAVVLLPGWATKVTWVQALAWAAERGGELPSRPVAAMLVANSKDLLKPVAHWTSEDDDASYAWYCNFDDGYQTIYHKGYSLSAVAVRLIPLESA